MKFNSIKIDNKISKGKGIEEINLKRLQNVIALVGKNGAGKTRILDIIEANLFSNVNVISLYDESISFPPKEFVRLKQMVDPYKDYFINEERIRQLSTISAGDLTEDEKVLLSGSKNRQKAILANHHQSILINQNLPTIKKAMNDQLADLQSKYIRRIRYSDIQILQNVIDEKVSINLSFENLIEKVAENTVYNEIQTINRSALRFLAKLPHQLATDQYLSITQRTNLEEKISYKRFLTLQKYIKVFLHKDLSWDAKLAPGKLTEDGNSVTFQGVWSLEKRVFNYAELSDGEKSLFTYALLFFLIDLNPELSIKSCILIIDEPELHLHANSEIDLIEGVKEIIGAKGQLIIATHSINILSILNYEEIFLVKNGTIFHPSSETPGGSLAELIDLEERANKLADFLHSISAWTYVKFMAECFLNPEVIESAREGDPQVEQFRIALKQNAKRGSNFLLDFGAGKGRLIQQLKDDLDFEGKIAFSALEQNLNLHSKLKGIGVKNIYSNYDQLPANKFDFVLLCNVLHEISIIDWVNTLNSILESLTEDGFLIIIEAMRLNKGERVDLAGFLVLGAEEFSELFSIEYSAPTIKIPNSSKSLCVVLNRNLVNEVTVKSVLNALKMLEKETLLELEELRTHEYENKQLYSIGRQSAFLAQQHINARIGQRILKSK